MVTKSEKFKLSDDQFKKLKREFPGHDSHSIGKRTEEIIKMYFKRKLNKLPYKDGLDFEICSSGEKIEVKGTTSSSISWAKLKVSGKPCHEQLKNGAPIYRITNVMDREVGIHILKYGKNFKMVPEPRWRLVQL